MIQLNVGFYIECIKYITNVKLVKFEINLGKDSVMTFIAIFKKLFRTKTYLELLERCVVIGYEMIFNH